MPFITKEEKEKKKNRKVTKRKEKKNLPSVCGPVFTKIFIRV